MATYFLTDLGIREAVDSGMLQFNPGLDDNQIQPATIDLKLKDIDWIHRGISNTHYITNALHNYWGRLQYFEKSLNELSNGADIGPIKAADDKLMLAYHEEVVMQQLDLWGRTTINPQHTLDDAISFEPSALPKLQAVIDLPFFLPYSNSKVNITQKIKVDDPFYLKIEPRSSLGRQGLSLDNQSHGEFERDYNLRYNKNKEIDAVWMSSNTFNILAIPSGEKFAQAFVCSHESPEFDHGYVIDSEEEIKALAKAGHFSIEPELETMGAHVIFRASESFLRTRLAPLINISKKKPYGLTREYALPEEGLEMIPGDLIHVISNEVVDLSDKIGIHIHGHPMMYSDGFTDGMLGSYRARSGLSQLHAAWFDPGYKGLFSSHPNTLHNRSHRLHKGEIIAFGRVIYFPSGVERPYGSEGLGSHYQNQSKLKVSQKG